MHFPKLTDHGKFDVYFSKILLTKSSQRIVIKHHWPFRSYHRFCKNQELSDPEYSITYSFEYKNVNFFWKDEFEIPEFDVIFGLT